MGRASEPVADADQAIAHWPGSGPLHAERANALIAANRYEEALAACDRLTALRWSRLPQLGAILTRRNLRLYEAAC
ncbi:tetratricopeptide repeat protein [Achromobacter spanius]|uniref:tetratricopeptide repeat protein n=1 Tax=Achromobacter spanius TaxID=217203 RepID=UPI0038010C2A